MSSSLCLKLQTTYFYALDRTLCISRREKGYFASKVSNDVEIFSTKKLISLFQLPQIVLNSYN